MKDPLRAPESAQDASQLSMRLPPRKLTQCDRLLNTLLTGSKITPLDSWQNLGIYRLASRIHDLRSGKHNGTRYCIDDEWVEVTNRWGESCKVKAYFIPATMRPGYKYWLQKERS